MSALFRDLNCADLTRLPPCTYNKTELIEAATASCDLSAPPCRFSMDDTSAMEGLESMMNVSAEFGINVFNDAVMRARLPKETYRQLQKTMKDGRHLDSNVVVVVANAMKDWALEKGATHYTH